jgi:polar amino acid transport system substrate-binding protein
MKRWQMLTMALLSSGPLLAAPSNGLRVLTEEYPPFNMAVGHAQVGGLSTEVVREMLRRAKISYHLDLLPWIRAFNITVLEPNTCLYSTTRTDNREHQFKWVGPLLENTWVLYAGPGSPKNIHALESARRFKIGGYSGDAESQYLIGLGFNVELTPTDELNARKLAMGRIDFWATSQYRGSYLVAREKLTKLQPVLTFNTVLLYLACNPAVPDSTIHQLSDALHGMQRDGYVTQLQKRYLQGEPSAATP